MKESDSRGYPLHADQKGEYSSQKDEGEEGEEHVTSLLLVGAHMAAGLRCSVQCGSPDTEWIPGGAGERLRRLFEFELFGIPIDREVDFGLMGV